MELQDVNNVTPTPSKRLVLNITCPTSYTTGELAELLARRTAHINGAANWHRARLTSTEYTCAEHGLPTHHLAIRSVYGNEFGSFQMATPDGDHLHVRDPHARNGLRDICYDRLRLVATSWPSFLDDIESDTPDMRQLRGQVYLRLVLHVRFCFDGADMSFGDDSSMHAAGHHHVPYPTTLAS